MHAHFYGFFKEPLQAVEVFGRSHIEVKGTRNSPVVGDFKGIGHHCVSFVDELKRTFPGRSLAVKDPHEFTVREPEHAASMPAFFFIENQISALPESPKMVHLGSDFVLGLGLGLQVVGSHVVDDVAGHVDSGDGFYSAQPGRGIDLHD